jgi:hypothetical protein
MQIGEPEYSARLRPRRHRSESRHISPGPVPSTEDSVGAHRLPRPHRSQVRYLAGPITMIRLCALLLANAFLPNAGLSQRPPLAVSAAPDGAAQITTANGKKIQIRKERGQVSISDAQIAPDGTVGWLAEYRVDGVPYPIPGTLIVWRAGKTIRRFPTGQSFYSWTFYAHGKQVAFHVGPLHTELKSHCELHDAQSGRLIAVWDGDIQSAKRWPACTMGLSH